MGGRFKTKSKFNLKIIKLLLIVLVAYLSFSFIYRYLYKDYINGLSNEEIINEVRNNTELSTFNVNKYVDPKYILKYTLNIDLNKDGEVRTLEVKDIVNIQNKPLVYVYTTHEGEKYSDEFLEPYNIVPTVKTAAFILKDYLEDLGIESYIENRSVSDVLKQNGWAYNRSYDASRVLITDIINEYDSLKLIIDLHRDSSSLEKTLLDVDGKRYARILFVIGTEYDSYEDNYNLAYKLISLLEDRVPGITRGITKKGGAGVNGIYNQNLSKLMVLMELGGQYNKIEDLNNSLEIVAQAILGLVEENEKQ